MHQPAADTYTSRLLKIDLTSPLTYFLSLFVCTITSFSHSFIHSDHFYSASSSPLLLPTQVLLTQHRYCVGVSHWSAQATVSEGLAKGPYMAARARVEPTTLRTIGVDSMNEPLCPTTWKPLTMISTRALYLSLAWPWSWPCTEMYQTMWLWW